jgi:TRAP-type C4-dicarboxylate transport system permease small subunit
MWRNALEKTYNAAGVLAALFMIGTLVMVVMSIAGRMFNFHLRGTDAYAGYCTAAAGFLALAPTLRRGEHIRVTLFLQRLGPVARHRLEILVHCAGLFLASAFAWFSIRLTLLSHEILDISTANDATPLWIPQLGMAIGASLLVVAILHSLIDVLAGRAPITSLPPGDEPSHVE